MIPEITPQLAAIAIDTVSPELLAGDVAPRCMHLLSCERLWLCHRNKSG